MHATLLKQGSLGAPADPWGLLLRAGTASLVDAVNAPIASAETPTKFCPAETKTAMSDAAADLLISCLTAYNTNKRQYLQIVKELNLRVPSGKVFALLNALEKSDPSLHAEEYIDTIGGETSVFLLRTYSKRWRDLARRLAFSNREGIDKLEESVRETLTSGNKSDVVEGFSALRRLAPDRARAIFAECLEKRKDAKLEIIKALFPNLEEEDAPLLIGALGKKGSAQRALVENLLSRLPNNEFNEQAIASADAVLPELGVFLPPNPKSPEFAALCIERVPLSHWEKKFGVSASEIVAAYPNMRSSEGVYLGWTSSFEFFGYSDEWAQELSKFAFLCSFCATSPQARQFFIFQRITPNVSPIARLWKTLIEKYPEEAYRRHFEQGVATFNWSEDVDKNNALKNLQILALRRQYEKRPWSAEFSEEYLRRYFSDGYDKLKAYNIDYLLEDLVFFSSEYRAKINKKISESKSARLPRFSDFLNAIDSTERFLQYLYGRHASDSTQSRPQTE